MAGPGRGARGSIFLVALFLLWQSIRSRRAKAVLLLMLAAYGSQLLLSKFTMHAVRLGEMRAVEALGVEGEWRCIPAQGVREVPDAAYDLGVASKKPAVEWFIETHANGWREVRTFSCYLNRENAKTALSLEASIPANHVRVISHADSGFVAFIRAAFEGAQVNNNNGHSREMTIHCSTPLVVPGPRAVFRKALDRASCVGRVHRDQQDVLRDLQRANEKFYSYELINLGSQLIVGAAIVALYAWDWKELQPVWAGRAEIVVRLLSLGALLYRAMSFGTILFDEFEGFSSGCSMEDVWTSADRQTFMCRSHNPLLPSLLWSILYFALIFAYDWTLAQRAEDESVQEEEEKLEHEKTE